MSRKKIKKKLTAPTQGKAGFYKERFGHIAAEQSTLKTMPRLRCRSWMIPKEFLPAAILKQMRTLLNERSRISVSTLRWGRFTLGLRLRNIRSSPRKGLSYRGLP